MRRFALSAAFVIFLGALLPLVFAQTNQGRTFAFLVACGDYNPTELKPVPFTVHEMKLFREVLIQSGFSDKNITFLNDKTDQPGRFIPNRENILREYTLMLERLRPEDSLVVALSGHGIQYKADASGFFCPLDAKLGPAQKNTLIAMEGAQGLLTLLDKTKAQRKLVIVNACRNEPATNAFLAAERLELVDNYNEEAPKGTVVLFACGKGQRSYFYPETDKREDRRNRSLFMYHLTEAWKGTYAAGKKVTLDHVVAEVRDRVEDDANSDFRSNQMPLVRRKFEGSWLLTKAAPDLPKPRAEYSKPAGKTFTNSIGMKMALIPAGKFLMGSAAGEKDRAYNQLQHEVEITKSFYMGVYEVTRGQFGAFVNASGYKTEAESSGRGGVGLINTGSDFGLKYNWRNTGFEQTDEHPVVNMSWNDANAFCAWLSRTENQEYTLSTEAQWEYACRGGSKTAYCNGDDKESLAQVGNVADAAYRKKYPACDWNIQANDGYIFTAPVGQFRANGFGLHDMHGNAWEWCKDWLAKDYYANSPRRDPPGPGNGSGRVLRGGYFDGYPWQCGSASRNSYAPDYCS